MTSTSALEFMPRPMCLVANERDRLVVQKDTVEILSMIKQPIVVVAIVGIYRTGKSFLMNRLMGRNKGFHIGTTLQTKTKGIWAWCRKHPKHPDRYLLLLDTEGLGDIEKGDDNYDNWIFALSVLLSCTLVYNWQSSLHGDALEKLSYVTRLTDLIKLKSSQDEEEEDHVGYVKYFPNLIWVLRDFTLTLELNGKPITADEYLRNALKLQKGTSKKVAEYNLPRQCIEEYFKEKKCFVLRRPVNKYELFRILDELEDKDLEPDFLREVNNFCEYIFTNTMAKSLEGRELNGSMICQLLETFVQTIQNGKILCMENAVKTMTDNVNGKAVQRAIAHYKEKLGKSLVLPVDMDELDRRNQESFEEAMKIFMSESMSESTSVEDQPHQKKLEALLNIEYEKKCEENNTCSKTFCSKLLDDLSKDLERNVTNGLYFKSGGHKNYSIEKQKVIELYQHIQGKGTMAEATLKERQTSWESREALILASDTALTKAELKVAEDKRNYENVRQQTLAAEEELRQQKQKFESIEKFHQESMKMSEKKMQEEKHKQEMDAIIKRKEEELSRAFEQRLKKVAEEKEYTISQLKKELDEARKQPVVTQNEQQVLETVVQAAFRGITQGVLDHFSSNQ